MVGENSVVRIIIKFSDPKANPADAKFLEALSRDAGATLVYLHPASGSAHVFEVRTPDLQAVLQRLTRQSGVIYAEEDRVKRKQ